MAGIQQQATNGIELKIGYCYGFLHTTTKLFNLFQPGDLRRDWNIAPFNYISTYTDRYYYNYYTPAQIFNRDAAKFRREAYLNDNKNKNVTPINYPLLRYADVLLMLPLKPSRMMKAKASGTPEKLLVMLANALTKLRSRESTLRSE